MKKRVDTFLILLKNKRVLTLFLGLTLPCMGFLIFNNQIYPKILAQLKKNKNLDDPSNLILFLSCVFNEIVIDFSLEILAHVCDFFTESAITHFLYNQLYNLNFSEFETKTPDEHYSEFLIKKNAFVKMVNLGIFSIPVNTIVIILHLYNLARERFLFNTLIFSSISIIYFLVSFKGIHSRDHLRNQLNSAIIEKNNFCRKSLDSFEICKASFRENSYISEFMRIHWKMTVLEIKYFFVSENYRLANRSILALLKMFFILVKVQNPLFDIASVFIRIKDLDSRILSLRNNFYFFLEYWNELKLIETDAISSNPNIQKNVENEDAAIVFSQDTSITFKHSQPISNNQNIVEDCDCIVATMKEYGHQVYHHCFNIQGKQVFIENQNVKILNGFESKNIFLFHRKTILLVGTQGCGKTAFLNDLIGIKNSYWKFSNFSSMPFDISNVSFCSQKQLIFNKSVIFNLCYGNPTDEKSIISRLKSLNLLNIFDTLENGIYTLVGSKSCGLSGGQRQIICLLRCVLKEADIYIFDQPTLFLDRQNIQLFFNLIEKLKDKTIIVSTVSDENSNFFDQTVYFK